MTGIVVDGYVLRRGTGGKETACGFEGTQPTRADSGVVVDFRETRPTRHDHGGGARGESPAEARGHRYLVHEDVDAFGA